jgi:hypothetical protein
MILAAAFPSASSSGTISGRQGINDIQLSLNTT